MMFHSQVDNPFEDDPFFSSFNVNIDGLPVGRSQFRYNIDDEFFQRLPFSSINRADVTVDVVFDKAPDTYSIEIDLHGKVEVPCDRCTELFFHPVEGSHRIVVKPTDKVKSIVRDEGLMLIPRGTTVINIAQDIYDYIVLSLPIQVKHPEGHCDPEMEKFLARFSAKEENEEEKENVQGTSDSPWSVLNDFLEQSNESNNDS
ncbi:MAG: DUF177 domain-containing protein [Chlorobi bacterium]|nr:DUF177 domain-containing protein [Chlorobiota bacterium]